MSLAACAKKLLCDPDVNQAEGMANALDFLGKQAIKNYTDDPALIIDIKEQLSLAMKPYLDQAEKAGAEVLDKYS